MTASIPDVHRILAYRTDNSLRLSIALCLCFVGLLILALDDRPPSGTVALACLTIAAGIGLGGLALWRRSHPERPRFVLSPMGVHYRFPVRNEILVPWRDIQGVDTIDIIDWLGGYRGKFRDVTVILVSKHFYDSHISVYPQGAWRILVIPKGSLVQIALHHQLLSVGPRAIREAVEARWRVFRDQPAGSASRTKGHDRSVNATKPSVPTVTAAWRRKIGRSDAAARPVSTPGSVVAEDKARAMSAWAAAKIIVPLIGIAVVLGNLLGIWATPGQIAAREERKKQAEWDQQREEEQRLFQEQLRRMDEERRRTR
jgi:hypothetical protein